MLAFSCIFHLRSSNGLCLGDKFITPAFNLLLDLLQASSPKLCGTEIEHFRVSNYFPQNHVAFVFYYNLKNH